jgi:peroxiredoxin
MKRILIIATILVLLFYAGAMIFLMMNKSKNLDYLENEIITDISDGVIDDEVQFVSQVDAEKNNLQAKIIDQNEVDIVKEELSDKNELVKEMVVKDKVRPISGIEKGNLAIDFKLKNLSGTTISLLEYRGQKPVIVEFWNSWCHNCIREMPQLQKIYNDYDGQVEIIGVNLLANNDSQNKVENFVKLHQITFPIVFDVANQTAKTYQVKATNTHFLINADGTIFDSFFIDLDEKTLKEFLKYNNL